MEYRVIFLRISVMAQMHRNAYFHANTNYLQWGRVGTSIWELLIMISCYMQKNGHHYISSKNKYFPKNPLFSERYSTEFPTKVFATSLL